METRVTRASFPASFALLLAVLLAPAPARAHEDPKLHAAIDGDVAALQAAARDGRWQQCIDLADEGQRIAAGHAVFEAERLARRETLSELAAAADAAGAAHRAAAEEHGVTSEAARDTRDAWQRAIAEHKAAGEAYDAFIRPRNDEIQRYEARRTELARTCASLEAAEERWVAARERLGPFCEEYGERLRRMAAGRMLSALDDPDAKLHAQASIDRELALHNCLHPVKALEYERELSAGVGGPSGDEE